MAPHRSPELLVEVAVVEELGEPGGLRLVAEVVQIVAGSGGGGGQEKEGG
jgi:hypothetical protein